MNGKLFAVLLMLTYCLTGCPGDYHDPPPEKAPYTAPGRNPGVTPPNQDS